MSGFCKSWNKEQSPLRKRENVQTFRCSCYRHYKSIYCDSAGSTRQYRLKFQQACTCLSDFGKVREVRPKDRRSVASRCRLFLISKFRRVLNAVFFLLGNSPASEFRMPTFRSTLSVPSSYAGILHNYLPMKMEQVVPKRRHIKFRRRWITQKKAYNRSRVLSISVPNAEYLGPPSLLSSGYKYSNPPMPVTDFLHLVLKLDSSWNVMAHGDARVGKWRVKLANGVGSQYPSHYLGTWCIQHYYRWCTHLGCQ